MKKNNPFTLSFGKEPKLYVERNNQFREIKEAFKSDNPPSSTYLITGVRGSGKTVLLTQLSKDFSNDEDWIVVELNPETDMLEYLAAAIYEQSNMKYKFINKEFSFSFKGISFSINGEKPVSNVITLLEIMLEKLKAKNKKVLICIDEVYNNSNVKTFIQQYQIFIRKNYSVFLLMTGLFENVRSLQNEKSLTFLYRALQMPVGPLNMVDVSNSFEEVLDIDSETATKLAKLTNGYAFAYQVLGYIFYENDYKKINNKCLKEFDSYLRDYVYEKIYYDLPQKEKEIVFAIAASNSTKDIMEAINMDKRNYSQYRDRLRKKGLIQSQVRGKVTFSLPRFKEFINIQKKFE